ncbi:proteasome assembly chaperone family protein [Arthrobacter sp. RIT-PI-e]|uniref:proteasome assembly chaperone family protein n=1 Tax=Arthrobacter sp. RIT-PI-e TaxID=1681197 RepID=UPI0009E4BCC5|nr:PAC2 family protein [Arthrobacter sp. RIT-PI-e]
MLDPRTLYNTDADILGEAAPKGLPLLISLTGFMDAGHVVEQVSQELLEVLDHEKLVEFDADQLLDYRGRRPRITFVEDHLTDYRPHRLELFRLNDGLGEPFLLLTGVEPDLQWERFVSAVTGLVRELEVSLVSWIHAIPMPVPHTRPIGVTLHGNRPDLIEGMNSWRPTAELQASIGHVLELRLIEAGYDVVGHVIHVPHYLAEAEYPPAAVAGLEYLGATSRLVLPTDRLRESGRDVERQIARQVGNSSEVQSVVSSLEQRYDEYADGAERRSLLVKDNSELASAEELGAAVEAYLASPQAEEETTLLWEAEHVDDRAPGSAGTSAERHDDGGPAGPDGRTGT